MNFYITYNDSPSGIYSSQVIDVVKFINNEVNIDVKLIALISIRDFISNRKTIKKQLPSAIVLPMFPKIKNWKFNVILLSILCIWYKPTHIIGRSVLATKLALLLRHNKKCHNVVYDGRGAISAEWIEYKVVTEKTLVNQIQSFEKEVILESDYRIAVSNQLIKYWKSEYGYNSKMHVVIPCTINSIYLSNELSVNKIKEVRVSNNFEDNDIVFVYSGSLAGWQSFDLLNSFLTPILLNNKNCKILFLSHLDEHIVKMKQLFPNQVSSIHLHPNDVPIYLSACDYGLLIRENSITNSVASPVKFAEYLACGLKIVISDNLGDYSDFVLNNNCGSIFTNFSFESSEKDRLRKIAFENFSKNSFANQYKTIFAQ